MLSLFPYRRIGTWIKWMHFGSFWGIFVEYLKSQPWLWSSRIQDWSLRSEEQYYSGLETKKPKSQLCGSESQPKSTGPTWSTPRSTPKASHSNSCMSFLHTIGELIWLVEAIWWWVEIQIQMGDNAFNAWVTFCLLAFHPHICLPMVPNLIFACLAHITTLPLMLIHFPNYPMAFWYFCVC